MSSYVNPLADVDANDATGTVKKNYQDSHGKQ